MGRPRVVVVGAGVAGLATAWWLARRGARVTLVEREAVPGVHASGRNAGLVRRLVEDPALAALGRAGADLLARPPADLSAAPLVRATGSLLVAGATARAGLERAASDAARAGVDVRLRAGREVGEHLGLRPEPDDLVAETPTDGVADPGAVLAALWRGLGQAEVARVVVADLDGPAVPGPGLEGGPPALWSTEARLAVAGGAAVGVDVRAAPGAGLARAPGWRRLEADAVVLAAGPWAADLAAAAGAARVPLVSLRRHLYQSGQRPDVRRDAAWIWDLERGFYVRPESGGLLVCACDEEPRPPEDARPAADALDRLAAAAGRAAPGLGELAVARAWAGLRTFAPDRRFVVGWDPGLGGLYWVAGLGGHGLTSGLAVGEAAARAVLGGTAPELEGLSPARFGASRGGAAPAAPGVDAPGSGATRARASEVPA